MDKYFHLCRDYTAILLNCSRDNRMPTLEERNQLLSFDGFGSISAYLHSHDFPGSWTESERPYHVIIDEIYTNIKSILQIRQPLITPGEIDTVIRDIKLSSLTSYYTPSYITEPIAKYCTDALKIIFPNQQSFELLEPSSGSGRFIYSLERNKQGLALDYTAVELNPISAASIYFDNTTVFNGGFENLASIASKQYDAIVGNIPFGNISVYDKSFNSSNESAERLSTKSIHNYFFLKASTLLKPGGIIAFVTTTGFCTSEKNSVFREYMCSQNNLIANIVLPTNLFEHQNTPVQTSLVIFQKPFEKKSGLSLDENYFVAGENATQFYFDETLNKSNKFGKPYLHYQYNELKNLRTELSSIIQKSSINNFLSTSRYDKNIASQSQTVLDNKPNNQLSLFNAIAKEVETIAKEKNTKSSKLKELAKTAVAKQYEGIIKPYYTNNSILIDTDYNNGKPFQLRKEDNHYFVEHLLVEASTKYSSAEITKGISLLVQIRDTYQDIVQLETIEYTTATDKRNLLNEYYDKFFQQFSTISNNRELTDYFVDKAILKGLEKVNQINNNIEKADVFYSSLVKSSLTFPTNLNTADALVFNQNYSAQIDIDLLCQITSKKKEEIIAELDQKIFFNSKLERWEIAANYLSGDIITKIEDCKQYLAIASVENPIFEHVYNAQFVTKSLEALEVVKPQFIPFHDLCLQFGNRWIPIDVYQSFATDLFKTDVELNYVKSLDEYKFNTTNSNSLITETFAVDTHNRKYDGLQMLSFIIIDKLPNATITYKDGDKTVTVKDEEGLRSLKIRNDEIKEKFIDFVNQLPVEKQNEIASLYNSIFNRTVKYQADGQFLQFPGLKTFSPRLTQANSVAHIIQNNGGIIDLPVGEGKTLVMIMAAHEMKRLGIVQKPMIIAMKANVEQIAATYREAYPNDKLLYPSAIQFQKDNRQVLMQQIANNNWDCIILSHEQFKTIPQSREKQLEVFNDEIKSLELDFDILSGEKASKAQLKGLTKRIETLKGKVLTITESIEKDPLALDFVQMGIDHLFVDESQNFKNLFYSSRHYNIAGLGSPEGSDRAFNLYIASRSLQEANRSDLNLTFLSGSTIKNSIVELYLLFKYLRPNKMMELYCPSFNTWAANFASKSTEFEYDVTGQITRKDRFRSFMNVPELSAIYSDITYYMNPKDSKLEKPSINHIPVLLEPTEQQKEYSLKLIEFAKNGDPKVLGLNHLDKDKAKKAKMAIACSYGKLMTLDMRCINENLYTDESNNKISAAASYIAQIYSDTNAYKGTQFVFCDVSTPKKEFNAYDALRDKLVHKYGIPKNEIRFIHEAKTEKQRAKLLDAFKAGDVRVLFGSTFKLGTGVNAQDRVVAHHHLDFTWTPEDMNQRNGRGARFGNLVAKEYRDNKVDVYTYATKFTVDVFRAQTLKTKEDFINQIKENDSSSRRLDEPVMDENSAVSYAEFIAMLSGDTSLLEKMKIEMQIANLEKEKKLFTSNAMKNNLLIHTISSRIPSQEATLALIKADADILKNHPISKDNFLIHFLGKDYTDIKVFSHELFYALYKIKGEGKIPTVDISTDIINNAANLGQYRGFKISYQVFSKKFVLESPNGLSYHTADAMPSANIDYTGRYFEQSLQANERLLVKYTTAIEQDKKDLALLTDNPIGEWPKKEKLDELKKKLADLEKQIEDNAKENDKKDLDNNLDNDNPTPDIVEETSEPYVINSHLLTQNLNIMENEKALQNAESVEQKQNVASTEAEKESYQKTTDVDANPLYNRDGNDFTDALIDEIENSQRDNDPHSLEGAGLLDEFQNENQKSDQLEFFKNQLEYAGFGSFFTDTDLNKIFAVAASEPGGKITHQETRKNLDYSLTFSCSKESGNVFLNSATIVDAAKNFEIKSPFHGATLHRTKMENLLDGRGVLAENVKFKDKEPQNLWLQFTPLYTNEKVDVEGKVTYKATVIDPEVKLRFYSEIQFKLPTKFSDADISKRNIDLLKMGNDIALNATSTKTGKLYTAILSPNPAMFRLNLSFPQNEKSTTAALGGNNFDSKQRVDLLKQNIHLPAFISHKMNVTAHKSGSYYELKVPSNDGKNGVVKLVCQKDTKNKTNAWIYFDNLEGNKAGNIITFMSKYMGIATDAAGMQRMVKEAVDFNPSVLQAEKNTGDYIPSGLNQNLVALQNSPKKEGKPDLEVLPLQSTQYLNTRGIDDGLATSDKYANSVFNKLHFLDERKQHSFFNTAFPMKNLAGEIVDVSMKNKGFQGDKSYSGFVEGGNRKQGLAVSSGDEVRIGKVDSVVIGEAFLDCMSYSKLHPEFLKNTVDLSYEGRITTPQLEAIQEVVSHYKPSNIILINDKDNGGYAYDCTILGHLNRGEQDPKFSFEFHNNSNQEKTVVQVTMQLPMDQNRDNLAVANYRFNSLAEAMGKIEFNGKPIVCEKVTYNEITNEYNLKGSFVRLHESHPTPFVFQQKVFEVCKEQFSNNLSEINVVNHKAPSGDWNQELMNKLGLDKSMIMANQNPFLGMNKEDAMQMSKSMGASQGQGLGNAKVNNNETELSSSGR